MPKWRKDSEFGSGPRVPLDRERRAVFRARLKMRAYRCPGRLTIAAAEVGRIMADMLGADGRLDPSIATLAHLAAVDVGTVVRALARLRECGFITWVRRLVRDAASGWRCVQTSNAYTLALPNACDTHFAKQVCSRVYRKVGSCTDRQARESAARQLEALGRPDQAAQLRASG